MPPGGQQAQGCYEIWLLHFVKHLLVYILVVIRHTRPLAQERHYRSENELNILKVVLPFEAISTIFEGAGSRLHLLQAMLMQQTCHFAGHAIMGWGKEVPCLVKCLEEKLSETRECWTIAHCCQIGFGDANHRRCRAHTLLLF